MLKALFVAAMLALPAAYAADGPGSRIRATPSGSALPSDEQKQSRRCESLRGEAKERCMKDARAAAAADQRTRGPDSTGGASGAGTGATSGTSGGATFGGSAPR